MQLQLLDINKTIEKEKLKQVTSTRIYGGSTFDPQGLFSENIFGRIGSSERKKRFGYIDLKVKVIHPEVYNLFVKLSPVIKQIIQNSVWYITKDRQFEVVEDGQGKTGLYNFITDIYEDNLDLTRLPKVKKQDASFILNNKDRVFIDKWLVLPAGIRDISTELNQMQYPEISDMYRNLLTITNSIPNDLTSIDPIILDINIKQIQNFLLKIDNWIKERLKGKSGILRGNVLKKTVDYSGRFYLTVDPKIKMGYVGLPYQYCLKLFELFAIHQLKQDVVGIDLIRNFLNIDEKPDVHQIKRFFTLLSQDPDILYSHQELKDYLITLAQDITKDKVVIYKRDPVENRDSWLAGDIIVLSEGKTLHLNPIDFPRMGADVDGDTIAVIALLTKEAIQEAKENMHPLYSKKVWYSAKSISDFPYSIELDAATAIYRATSA